MVELNVYTRFDRRTTRQEELEDSEELFKPTYEREVSRTARIDKETKDANTLKEFENILTDYDGEMDEGGSAGYGPILITTKDNEVLFDIKEKDAEEEAKRRFEELEIQERG